MSAGLAVLTLLCLVGLDQVGRWLNPGVVDPPWIRWPLISAMALAVTVWLYLRGKLGPFVSADVVPERVSNAMNLLPDAVLLLDQDGRIVLVNDVFKTLVSPQAVQLGDSLDAHPWWCEALSLAPGSVDLPWTRVLKAAVPQVRVALPFSLHGHSPVPVRLTCSPVSAGASKLLGCLVMVAEQGPIDSPTPHVSNQPLHGVSA
jgi:PAS domain-containing protein